MRWYQSHFDEHAGGKIRTQSLATSIERLAVLRYSSIVNPLKHVQAYHKSMHMDDILIDACPQRRGAWQVAYHLHVR